MCKKKSPWPNMLQVACVSWLGLLCGCTRTPTVIPIESLTFPVILIIGSETGGSDLHAEVNRNKDDLSLMRVERYSPLTDTTLTNRPMVIDSNATVCEMQNIEGKHGSFWMMANPTGLMPISFTLIQRTETGIDAARSLIASCDYVGRERFADRTELLRDRIRKAETMAEIILIVDDIPDDSGEITEGSRKGR